MSISCSKEYTLTIASGNPPVYWTMETDVGPGSGWLDDSTGTAWIYDPGPVGEYYMTADPAPALFGNGVEFTGGLPPAGISGYANIGGTAFDSLSNTPAGFSVWCWIKIASLDAGASFQYAGGSDHGLLRLWLAGTGSWVRCRDDGGTNQEDVPLVPTVGSWFMLHMFYDATAGKMGYSINDGAENLASFTPIIAGSVQGYISASGTSNPTHAPTSWLLDEIGCKMDGKLTPAQVSYLYNAGSGRTWPFTLP